jgi:hypothetical protein
MAIISKIQRLETTSSVPRVVVSCPTYEQGSIDILPADFYPSKDSHLTHLRCPQFAATHSIQTVYRVYTKFTKQLCLLITHSNIMVYGENKMTETISFKLSEELTEKLKKLAEENNDPSRHICAKSIVEDYIMNPPSKDPMLISLLEIRHSILLLREDFATAVAGLLVRAGTVKDMKEAIKWTRKYMPLEG